MPSTRSLMALRIPPVPGPRGRGRLDDHCVTGPPGRLLAGCAAGEDGGGPDDGPELVLGDVRRGDGTVREGGEAAVRREEHAIRAEDLDGPPGLRDDLLRRLHPIELLIDDAEADPAARGQVLQ